MQLEGLERRRDRLRRPSGENTAARRAPEQWIAAVRYAPSAHTRQRAPLVLCPALGEEQAHARGALHWLGACLARAGHATVVYDPFGHGDSSGESADVTLDGLAEDLATVWHYADGFRRGEPAPIVFATRFGATVAAQALAIRRIAPSRIVLAAPVIDTRAAWQAIARKSVATQLAATGSVGCDADAILAGLAAGRPLESDGHQLSARFYQETVGFDAARALAVSRAPLDVIAIRSRAEPEPGADVRAIAASRPDATIHRVTEVAFWNDDRHRLITRLPALAAEIVAICSRDDGDAEVRS
jgi:pimeloyl-ACP methyl ester carboxylesterase